MKVKVARKPDTKAIAAIHSASFHKGWDAAYVAESLRVEGTLALVAEDYAGFALLRVANDQAHIVSFAVHPEARGQGIGKALLAALLAEAARRKAKTVVLRVNERNEAAVRLYERNGFSRVARHAAHYSNPDGVRSDAIEMRRDL
jgi:ribosomal-protein-alanine N-acetyltransferase